MFRVLICQSSGARDYKVYYHVGRFVLVCCKLEMLQAKARIPNTTPA